MLGGNWNYLGNRSFQCLLHLYNAVCPQNPKNYALKWYVEEEVWRLACHLQEVRWEEILDVRKEQKEQVGGERLVEEKRQAEAEKRKAEVENVEGMVVEIVGVGTGGNMGKWVVMKFAGIDLEWMIGAKKFEGVKFEEVKPVGK